MLPAPSNASAAASVRRMVIAFDSQPSGALRSYTDISMISKPDRRCPSCSSMAAPFTIRTTAAASGRCHARRQVGRLCATRGRNRAGQGLPSHLLGPPQHRRQVDIVIAGNASEADVWQTTSRH